MAEKRKREGELVRIYVERIKEKYPKSAVILFGSRARGEELPYSDYDLLVVLERVDDKLGIIEELRRLKPRGVSVDLLVVSMEELKDLLVRGMLKRSQVLYNGLSVDLESEG